MSLKYGAMFLFLIFLANSVMMIKGENCAIGQEAVASCARVALASEAVRVVIVVNVCHQPVDVLFTVQSPAWTWQHTFINADEWHALRRDTAPDTLLHVTLARSANTSLHVTANFMIEGLNRPVFFNHTFSTSVEQSRCLPVQHETQIKDYLALLVFAALCVLISLSAMAFVLCLRRKRGSDTRQCCCLCCYCALEQKHSQHLLESGNSSERPLSSCSMHSSSHGSYPDADYESIEIYDSLKRRTRPIVYRNPRKTKSLMVQMRHSMYNDSYPMDELPAIAESVGDGCIGGVSGGGGMQFGSLGRNFRSKKGAHSGGGAAPNWTAPPQDEEYYSDLSLDSLGQVPAQEILNLEPGSSQPHYSATKFHSFRAKKSPAQKSKAAARRKLKYATNELPQTPESPLISKTPNGDVIIANGSVQKNSEIRGKLGRVPHEDKHSSSQFLLHSDMSNSKSFY